MSVTSRRVAALPSIPHHVLGMPIYVSAQGMTHVIKAGASAD